MFKDDEVEIVHNFDCKKEDGCGQLYYLGEAIKKLDKIDYCYFTSSWKNSCGCKVEEYICELYGIPAIYEDDGDYEL